jgi:hypothetical protein
MVDWWFFLLLALVGILGRHVQSAYTSAEFSDMFVCSIDCCLLEQGLIVLSFVSCFFD